MISLYASLNRNLPNDAKYDYKSLNLGENMIQIHPSDLAFSIGWLYIGVMGNHFGYNSYTISISYEPACIFLTC